MQISIPHWKRPISTIYTLLPDEPYVELVDVSKILFENGFATSRKQAKQMINNGEVWKIPKEKIIQYILEGRTDGLEIRENIEKCFDIWQDLDILDVLYVGGKKDLAMCHRINFN